MLGRKNYWRSIDHTICDTALNFSNLCDSLLCDSDKRPLDYYAEISRSDLQGFFFFKLFLLFFGFGEAD